MEERLLHTSQAFFEGLPGGDKGLRELHIKWAPWPDMRLPGGRDFGASQWAWFWQWAAEHTPLHTLTFDVGGEEAPAPSGFQAARAALLAARQELAVGFSDFAELLPAPL